MAGWPLIAAAQPDRISILYHEPLADLQMRGAAELSASAKTTAPGQDLQFAAFGRSFVLSLENNDSLIRRLSSEQRDVLDTLELYRGRVEGAEGSWARISRDGNELSGLIFDGIEFFAIDSFDRVAASLIMPRNDNGHLVIFRLNDTTGVIGDLVQAPITRTGPAVARKGNAAPLFLPKVVLGQQLSFGVVSDAEYAELVGASDVSDSLIKVINIVDGIFLEELGVHLDLVALHSYDTEPDPFDSTTPGFLLDEFERFKSDSTGLRPLGLLHLVTGRVFQQGSSSAETLGIANIGVLCEPRDGVGVTRSRGSVVDAIVMAHEIGHNFGAPHDGESGSACEATPPGKLMDPFINGSIEFSQCSIDQILLETAGAACLTPLLPANMSLWLQSGPPPSIIEPDEGYEFSVAIENTSGVDAVDVEMLIDAPSIAAISLQDRAGTHPDDCENFVRDRPYRCYWSEFPNGGRFEAAVSFRASEPGPTTIDVGITSLTESDSTDDDLHFTVNVLPYVNLAASLDPPGVLLRPNQTGAVTASLRNVGAESAHDVIARIFVGQKLEFLGASIGECVRTGDDYFVSYDCPIGTLTQGEAIDFVVDFRPNPHLSAEAIGNGANLGLSVSSYEPEKTLDMQNNGASTRITIGDSIGDVSIEQFAAPRTFVGDTFLVFVDLRNDGPDTINDVIIELMELSGSAGPTLTEITATGAPCQLPLAAGDHICEITELAAGDEVNLRFSITTADTGSFRFALASETSSADPDTTNDNSGSFVTVLPQPPPPPPPPPPADATPAPAQPSSGGGGGGAMDPLALSLFGILFLLMRASARHTAGVHTDALHALRDSGRVTELSRGLYRLAEIGEAEHPDLVVVAAGDERNCLPDQRTLLSRHHNPDPILRPPRP